MIREIKKIALLARKNTVYRTFLALFLILFLYLFYVLYQKSNTPFVFFSNNTIASTDLLHTLSQNIAPLCFYTFSIFFISDITTNYFNYINPILKIRNKKIFKIILSHCLFISFYSLSLVLAIGLIYNRLTNFMIPILQILYGVVLIILLQLILTLFYILGFDFIGYILDIIILTCQISLTYEHVYIKTFYNLILIIVIVILNYLFYKHKEII